MAESTRSVIVNLSRSKFSKFLHGNEEREIHLLPTRLRILNREDQTVEYFLLGPLGFTEIMQRNKMGLKILSYGEKKADRSDLSVKKLSLTFKSREDREMWLNLIISECSNNYFEDLIKMEGNCTRKFIRLVNDEIWKAVLSDGNETLRCAIAACPGTHHIELIRMIVAIVVDWMKYFLLLDFLDYYHSECFVAFFCVLLQDKALRAVLTLIRPGQRFVHDFIGTDIPSCDESNNKISVAQQKNIWCVSAFTRFLEETMSEEKWLKIGVFLHIVEHPAANGTCSIQEELNWIRKHWCGCFPMDWKSFSTGLTDVNYFAFYFIQRKMTECMEVQASRRIVELLQNLPESVKESNSSARTETQNHFTTCVEVCKFTETWNIFCGNKSESEFNLACRKHIWTMMEINKVPELCSMFLPSMVCACNPGFPAIIGYEMANSVNKHTLSLLNMNGLSSDSTTRSDSLVLMRSFIVDRVILWVSRWLGKTVLDVNDVSMFTNFLSLCVKSVLVRAMLAVVVPLPLDTSDSFDLDRLWCELNQLAILESKYNCEQFLCFLQMCDHPLVSQGSGVVDSVSNYSDQLSWKEESKWIKEANQWSQDWFISFQELSLILQSSPYFAFRIFLKRLNGNSSVLPLLLLKIPNSIRGVPFEANFEVRTEQFSDIVDCLPHFDQYLKKLEITVLWKAIHTDILGSSEDFAEETQHRMLQMKFSASGDNGFQRMVKNITDFDCTEKLDGIPFESVIPLFFFKRIADENLHCLFPHRPKSHFTVTEVEKLHSLYLSMSFFLNHLAAFCSASHTSQKIERSMSSDFLALLSCLDSIVSRALILLLQPVWLKHSRSDIDSGNTAMISILKSLENERLILYLLKVLKHPGIVFSNSELSVSVVSWDDESKWMMMAYELYPIAIDNIELLSDPAYLLFRHLTRKFEVLDDRIICYTLTELDLLAEIASIDVVFKAQSTYYPCRRGQYKSIVIQANHFKLLQKYCRFHSIWHILLPDLQKSSISPEFLNSVVWNLWCLVSGINPNNGTVVDDGNLNLFVISRPFSLLNVAAQNNQVLSIVYDTYLQVYAQSKIEMCEAQIESALYFVLPTGSIVKPFLFGAHQLLVEKILAWLHALLDVVQPSQEDYGRIFVALLTACLGDVAIRALVVSVVPSQELVQDLALERNKTAANPLSFTDAIEYFIGLLTSTVKDSRWREQRKFMSVLQLDVENAGTPNEVEPVWELEAAWIVFRSKQKAPILTWKTFSLCLIPDSPVLFLFLMAHCLNTPEQLTAALHRMPQQYLTAEFDVGFSSNINSAGKANHFVIMCLNGSVPRAPSVVPSNVFRDRDIISDEFCMSMIDDSFANPDNPKLIQVHDFIRSTFLDANGYLNVLAAKKVPNLASILLKCVDLMSENLKTKMNELVVGSIVLMVLLLESFSPSSDLGGACTLPRVCFRTVGVSHQFFESLKRLHFHKWFCVLASTYSGQFGANFDDNLILNQTMSLTKDQLSRYILGYFSLCVKFYSQKTPDYTAEFVSCMGVGRPFFTSFMHPKELLGLELPKTICRIFGIQKGSILHNRFCNRELFYDVDHASMEAFLGCQFVASKTGICSNLDDEEAANLLSVSLYLHDLANIHIRLQEIVKDLLLDANAAKRGMLKNLFRWIVESHINYDLLLENDPSYNQSNNRLKWGRCSLFTTVSLENLVECAGDATTASHCLKDHPQPRQTLDILLKHYVESSAPREWSEKFKGTNDIAFFIKYVDTENQCLAFQRFYEINAKNKLFLHYLLLVRKKLPKPIVSGKQLVGLISSSGEKAALANDQFFQKLRETGNSHELFLKVIYHITAHWMQIKATEIKFPLPPRNAQIITVLTVATWAQHLLRDKRTDVGRAFIAQVGTGEGKSLIIAMTAIYFSKVLNKRVHILENNLGLLLKDVETMRPLYAKFGIMHRMEGTASEKLKDLTHSTIEGQQSKDLRNEFCQFGITYTLRRNVELYYQDCIRHGIRKPLQNTVLIVDEVDDLIVDRDPNQAYVCPDGQNKFYMNAFRHFSLGHTESPDEFSENSIWALAQYHVKNARGMSQGKHYERNGDIFSLKPEGVGHDGSLEYLKYKATGIDPVLKTCYYVQSIPYILSQYDCISGFSGSLGSDSEREFLQEQYKVWCCDTPNFLNTCNDIVKEPPKLMTDFDSNRSCVHAFPDANSQLSKIVSVALEMYRKVPVLIIAKNIEEVYDIESRIAAAITSCISSGNKVEEVLQLFLEKKKGETFLDSGNWSAIVKRATKPVKDCYCITITDPFGGRGHDFDCADAINAEGGLLVILTSIPNSARDFRQWIGRTGRKDNKGQYSVILNRQDELLANNSFILDEHQLMENGTKTPHQYDVDVIGKLLSKQDEKQKLKLQGLKEKINRGIMLNRLCDLFYAKFGVMKEETWPFKHQQLLRNLLVHYMIQSEHLDSCIAKFFEEHGFTRYDSGRDVVAPDVSSCEFWSQDMENEFTQLQAEAKKNTE